MLDESIGSYYWQAFEPNESRDAVADVILSCNETHIIAILSSGKLCITRITEDDFTDHQSKLIESYQAWCYQVDLIRL
jgi:hypothetical protein